MAAPGNKQTCSEPGEEKEDPGAAPYGNFINYYTFNPPENRLRLIPSTLLEDVRYQRDTDAVLLLLDVGCNSG
ncbi:pre-miRNA 5'-monophosphate methyltransferase, partial [Clarias magur]